MAEYLELERELGVRVVECDKSLLEAEGDSVGRGEPPRLQTPPRPVDAESFPRQIKDDTSSVGRGKDSASTFLPHFVFLHDRPLTAKAVEMMSKIIVALGETADTAPIIIEKPIPKVPLCVVLGGRALAKFFPGKKAGPGDWIKSDGGRDILVTYSPEYILRFAAVSPTTLQIKQSMWRSLKVVKQRLAK